MALLRPLVQAKADVNCAFEHYWFRTPLHRAASRGHADMCRLLLALRADSSLPDSHGAAPIHLVASKGRPPIVELLLKHDAASAGAGDFDGRTPLDMAKRGQHTAVAELLESHRQRQEEDIPAARQLLQSAFGRSLPGIL